MSVLEEPPGQIERAASSGPLSFNGPVVAWDQGTAYELFISLHVLHHPDDFGLRPSWAAGVRQRLPAEVRRTLEEADTVLRNPLVWVNTLPDPKDAATVLWTLRGIPAEKRLDVLSFPAILPFDLSGDNLLQAEDPAMADLAARLRRIAMCGDWDEDDREAVRQALAQEHKELSRAGALERLLDAWRHPADLGERYLHALQAYVTGFFAEEEEYLRPVLAESLARSREQANYLQLPELTEHLTQGLKIQGLENQKRVIFVPSYWSTPLTFLPRLPHNQTLLVFGARPAGASLIPGEIVPDALLLALKALADPTRLRIMRYLAAGPLTPSALSRKLRLRPPTVIHHISALRRAALVQITFDRKADRRYALRREMLDQLPGLLEHFLTDPASGDDEQ